MIEMKAIENRSKYMKTFEVEYLQIKYKIIERLKKIF